MSEFANIETPMEQEGATSVVRTWLRKIGDRVERDEPIVELETDKVAVEVAAPASGILTEIKLDAGDEAPPGALLGLLQIGAARTSEPPAHRQSEPLSAPEPTRGARLSPLVRRLLSEHGVSPEEIHGSGRDGRITHADVLAHIAEAPADQTPARLKPAREALTARRVPHTPMRKSIAAHMSQSVATAPHVTAIFEADFTALATHRAKHKAAYANKLTYSAYFVAAAAAAMGAAPNVNARWRDEHLELFADVNVGMGVALGDEGLVVPVIRRAQTLSLREISERLHDLTARARAGKLTAADVQGGTFTISNHGVSGSLVAAPIIINQPQSAILGIGKLEKRVVVREVDGVDAIQIRPMAFVSLSIDHRALDGHQTNAWLTRFVEILETWPLEDPS